MSDFVFQFVKTTTGEISGEAVLTQTEDAINAIGQIAQDANTGSSDALATAQQALQNSVAAQNSASSALTNSQNAVQQVNTLTQTVNTYDQKITQAVSQSTSAVQTATAAQESASAAQSAAAASQSAAESSASLAQQAQDAAETAQQQASAAQTAAESAQDQSENAAQSAQSAQELAQQAQSAAESASNSATALASTAVMFTSQELEEEQQLQARTNIGAAASANAVLTGTTNAETIIASGGFTGTLTGLASQAAADGNGNNIVETYATIANTYTKAQVDAKVSSVYRYSGSVDSYDDLPSSNQVVGDTYNVLNTGANYAWDGSAWDKLSETIDLSGYLTITSAQQTYLPIATAQSTYLTISSAQSTYLSQSSASSTYLSIASAQSTYLSLSGGTMTGGLILNADPTTPLGAATKQYVDSAISTGTSAAVLYTTQTLSQEQQTQACSNIGTMPAQDLISVCNDVAGGA